MGCSPEALGGREAANLWSPAWKHRPAASTSNAISPNLNQDPSNVSEESSLSRSKTVFQQFYSKLVETLPMDDAVFTTKLFSNNLLPGDLKNQLKLVHRTSAEKAVLFLDSAVKPSVTSDDGSSFDKLLHVMEDIEYQRVKELAEEIRTSLRKRSSSNHGNYHMASY